MLPTRWPATKFLRKVATRPSRAAALVLGLFTFLAVAPALRAAAPVVNSILTASGETSTAFSYQITASNTPTSFSAPGLPAGLSVNPTTGVISGTLTTAASTQVIVLTTRS
jgi:hypothetical protein